MYQALYRKWRPQTFDQVIGQEHITETLKNQVRQNRLSHAYIFIGTRGTGKTTCARILAKAVNCEHPVDGNPCGRCPACKGITDGSVMDVVELDAASNNGVDSVRALREEAVFSPAEVKKRVYIIDEVHMLSTPAFNALLKILEEPPEHLLFILATTELQKVPATILSRCQRHSFRRIDNKTLANYLEYVAGEEHFDLSHDAAELIARMAEGGVRDGLSLLDQCSSYEKIDTQAVYSAMGLAGNRRIAQLFEHVLNHDTAAALNEFSAMWMDGKAPASLLQELGTLLRDVLLMQVAPKSVMELASGGFDREVLSAFARRCTRDELLFAAQTVQNSAAGIRDAKNPRMAVELCLVSLCGDLAGESVAGLKARISRLEEAVARGITVRHEPAPKADDERVIPEGPMPESSAFEPEEPMPAPRRYAPEEPEDEPLDVFIEEQPEDSFFDRKPKLETPKPMSADVWKAVCGEAAKALPREVRMSLNDDSRMRVYGEGDVLKIEAKKGFLLDRLKRLGISEIFSAAAKTVTGRDMSVRVSELNDSPREQRSLDELKQFKEVTFINTIGG